MMKFVKKIIKFFDQTITSSSTVAKRKLKGKLVFSLF